MSVKISLNFWLRWEKQQRRRLASIEVYRKVKNWLQIIMEMWQIKSYKQDAAWCHQSLCEVINLSHFAFPREFSACEKANRKMFRTAYMQIMSSTSETPATFVCRI